MSEKRFCDRCGASIASKEEAYRGIYKKVVRGHVVFWKTGSEKEHWFDLCDECHESFTKWIEEGRSDAD